MIDIQIFVKKKFKVIVFVKVEIVELKVWVGVWVRVDNKNEEDGFFDNMSDRFVKLKEWKFYIVEGIIDENSKLLSFGGLCLYNGKFYFDKFELFIENIKGVFEFLIILNLGFEIVVKNGEILKWSLGIRKNLEVKVKEYKIILDKFNVYGNYGLLIEGSGIVVKEIGRIGNVEGVLF